MGQAVGQKSASVSANDRERSKSLPGAVADCSFQRGESQVTSNKIAPQKNLHLAVKKCVDKGGMNDIMTVREYMFIKRLVFPKPYVPRRVLM